MEYMVYLDKGQRDNLIDDLYEISQDDSIETFEKNLTLYNMFLYNSSGFSVSGFDEKRYKIACTILKNYNLIKDKFRISDLIEQLQIWQEMSCFKIAQNKDAITDDIDKILEQVRRYNEIKQILEDVMIDEQDSLIKNSINSYLNSDIFIQYLDALTNILSKNYLTIDNDKCNEIIKLIENDNWFNNYLQGKFKNNMLHRDMDLKYIKRILSIKEFITDEEVTDDILVDSIINNKVKDLRLIENLIKELNSNKLLSIFNYDIKKLIEFILNIDYVDDFQRTRLIGNVFNKYLNQDDYEYIFNILLSDLNNNKIINLFTEEVKKQLFKYALNDSVMDTSIILYMLENSIYNDNFISNCMNIKGVNRFKIQQKLKSMNLINQEIVNKNDINELIKNYNLNGIVIDYNFAINLLDLHLNNQMELDKESLKGVIRSIITKTLEEKNIENVGIMFNNINGVGGSYNNEYSKKYICINETQIDKFLNLSIKSEDKFDLFITMFHEITHAVQQKNIEDNKYDFNTYFMLKEDIIKEYDMNYYDSNYKTMLEEIDARRGGIDITRDFFSTNFPQLAPIINQSLDFKREHFDYEDYNKKHFSISEKEVLVNAIFDKIISFHPNILEQYPILQLEYNKEGKPKNINNMDLGENKELIQQIYFSRYGDDSLINNKTI